MAERLAGHCVSVTGGEGGVVKAALTGEGVARNGNAHDGCRPRGEGFPGDGVCRPSGAKRRSRAVVAQSRGGVGAERQDARGRRTGGWDDHWGGRRCRGADGAGTARQGGRGKR